METIAVWFRDIGLLAYPLVLLGGLATLGSAVALLVGVASPRSAANLAVATGIAGLLVVLGGAAAFGFSLHKVEEVLAMVNAADRATLLNEGTAEARSALILGLILGALPLGVAAGLAALAFEPDNPGRRTVLLGAGLAALGIVGGMGTFAAYEGVLREQEMRLGMGGESDLPPSTLGVRIETLLRGPGLVCGTMLVVGVGLVVAGASGPSKKVGPG